MKNIQDIVVEYSFKSNERKLIHIAFKAIRNKIPLFIRDEDFAEFESVFKKVYGYRKKMPLKMGDGRAFKRIRAEYRKKFDESKKTKKEQK